VNSLQLPRVFSALLLDCDGVLVDSTELSALALRRWAEGAQLDADHVIQVARGHRILDIMDQLVSRRLVEQETRRLLEIELSMARATKACLGAQRLLARLHGGRWAVVTSSDRKLAEARLDAAQLPRPPVLVAAEDVAQGKPSPECYLLAASRLRAEPSECLALDDLGIGVAAAINAGSAALLVSPEASQDQPCSIRSLDEIVTSVVNGGVRVDFAIPTK